MCNRSCKKIFIIFRFTRANRGTNVPYSNIIGHFWYAILVLKHLKTHRLPPERIMERI